MKIRKGDTVIVLKGSSRKKTGVVMGVLPESQKVIVSGINIRTMHKKPRVKGEKGSIQKKEGPINVSNVALLDPKTKTPTRVRYSGVGRAKQRIAKSGTPIVAVSPGKDKKVTPKIEKDSEKKKGTTKENV